MSGKISLIVLTVALYLTVCAGSSFADEVAIKGYLYYWDHFVDGEDDDYAVSYPMDDVDVTLFKRNSSSGWDQYGSSVTSDSDGYYVFEDIDTGDGANDLCTNADWFRVEADATELPLPLSIFDIEDRFSYKEVRPSDPEGIPDDGDIRVDFVFQNAKEWTPVLSFNSGLFTVQGHYVASDSNEGYSPENGDYDPECPIGGDPFDGMTCIYGHFTNSFFKDPELEANYSFYPFSKDSVELTEGYTYWDPDWPEWATHRVGGIGTMFILVDFVGPLATSKLRGKLGTDSSPTGFALYQPKPNPASDTVNIDFAIPRSERVTLKIYDIKGRCVATPVDGEMPIGIHSVDVDVSSLAAGVYIYRLETANFNQALKMVVK